MSDPVSIVYAREMMTIWEEALSLGTWRSLLSPDLSRAREHLEKLNVESGTRHIPNQLFFFYRIGMLITRHAELMTMSQFSEALSMPLSTATRVVDWLVKAGYVTRVPDPQDRRIVRVALTSEGEKLYKLIHTHVRQRMESILRQFTLQERKDLLILSHKLVQAVKTLND